MLRRTMRGFTSVQDGQSVRGLRAQTMSLKRAQYSSVTHCVIGRYHVVGDHVVCDHA